ncbi:MAG: hypothetical protein AB8G17_11755 [Gammaproteobacteria bacterium]
MKDAESVLFLGSSYWAAHLCTMLNEYSTQRAFTFKDWWRWLRLPRRRVCLVGVGPADSWKRQVFYQFARWSKRLRLAASPTIFWIGSDVLRLTSGLTEMEGFRHVAGAQWLADEVRAHGYPCGSALFPVALDTFDVQPFPEIDRLQVLCYIPDKASDVHGGEEILEVATECPDIDFRVVGGSGTWCAEAPANVVFAGWVDDMRAAMRAAHVVLRRTPHDAFSAIVREGMLSGRHVVFTYDVEGVWHVPAGSAGELKGVLTLLSARLGEGSLTFNEVPAAQRARLTDTRAQAQTLADELA